MKTLLLAGYGVRLRFRRGLLIVESKGEKREVPLVDLEQVVVATSGVWLSSKVVRKLVEHGVDLVFLDSRGMPVGRVYPPFINKTVETRRAQYASYGTSRALHVVREIVYGKIYNQASVLRRYYYNTRMEELREAYERILELANKARHLEASFEEARERLRLIEAEAARTYWPSYALLLPRDLGFQGRDQDAGDPVNTVLNYSYGVLYAESWRALVLAGLDPYAGYLHVDRSGRPVLAFDFVEMFRFAADLVALNLFRRGWRPKVESGLLDYESRRRVVEALNDYLENTKVTYIDEAPLSIRQAMKKAAYALASYLRGDGTFEAFTYRW
jgi:CRISPR-associated protein Cas1